MGARETRRRPNGVRTAGRAERRSRYRIGMGAVRPVLAEHRHRGRAGAARPVRHAVGDAHRRVLQLPFGQPARRESPHARRRLHPSDAMVPRRRNRLRRRRLHRCGRRRDAGDSYRPPRGSGVAENFESEATSIPPEREPRSARRSSVLERKIEMLTPYAGGTISRYVSIGAAVGFPLRRSGRHQRGDDVSRDLAAAHLQGPRSIVHRVDHLPSLVLLLYQIPGGRWAQFSASGSAVPPTAPMARR